VFPPVRNMMNGARSKKAGRGYPSAHGAVSSLRLRMSAPSSSMKRTKRLTNRVTGRCITRRKLQSSEDGGTGVRLSSARRHRDWKHMQEAKKGSTDDLS